MAPSQPTHALPGVGPKMAERLAERGLHTIEDLLFLLPRRYDDARAYVPLSSAIAQARQGQEAMPTANTATPGRPASTSAMTETRVTTAGIVLSSQFHRRGRKRWLDARLAGTSDGDESARLLVRWFNAYPNLAERLARGCRVVLSGRLRARVVGGEMTNPDILSVTAPGGVSVPEGGRDSGGSSAMDAAGTADGDILPRYTDIPGVPAATLRRACMAAVERAAGGIDSGVPEAACARMGLVPLGQALAHLHCPPADTSAEEVAKLNLGQSEWHRRVAFEELFVLGLAVAKRRQARRAHIAVPCPVPPDRAQALARALPFVLTGAQERVIATIGDDLANDRPMSRLLQGDVGSGKTAVAFAAALQVARAGRQVAFMAPTEILAEQHATTLMRWCESQGLQAALLTAATARKERSAMMERLAAGNIDVLIGTHALLSQGVDFAALGLVIIDEQHRFGVAQRFDLRAKGAGDVSEVHRERGADSTADAESPEASAADAGAPHLLVMTATPIPRTLALTAYGDLDVSILDEMPPGREPPQTLVLSGAAGREHAHALVRKRLAAGQRVYVVCPLISPSEGDGPARADAESTAERLRGTFAPARIGLVHGRMPRAERERAMEQFRRGELDVLVATTVIEVGVDVPEATVMVILDAHQFGLAQLHQLRGRVGRGGGSSACLLMTRRTATAEGAERVAVLAATSDGFRIAEEDLRMRGPGELLGARQAGLPRLRYGDLRAHGELLRLARQAADEVLALDPALALPEHLGARRALAQRAQAGDSDPGASAAGGGIYGAESG